MSGLRMTVVAASDVGLKRSHNEDSHAIWAPEDPAERERRGALVVVADGMGGSQAGEVASRLAVETVVRRYREGDREPLEDLRDAFLAAHQAVSEKSRDDASLSGMGSTCTGMVVRGGEAWVAHVGDSRAYLVRRGELRQLTQDHSLVAQLVERRQLTPEEARVDRRRNVVTRSVGVGGSLEVDAFRIDGPLEPDDTFLLCSDGLHGQVQGDELAAAASGRDLERACQDLVGLANRRGGPDNITVVLVRLEAPQPALRPAGLERGRGPGSASRGRDRRGAGEARGASPRPGRTLLMLVLALLALALAVGGAILLLGGVLEDARRLERTGDSSAAGMPA